MAVTPPEGNSVDVKVKETPVFNLDPNKSSNEVNLFRCLLLRPPM